MKDPDIISQVEYETELAAALDLNGTPGVCTNGKCQKGWASYMGVVSSVQRSIRSIKAADIPAEWKGKEAQYAMKFLGNEESNKFYESLFNGVIN